MKLTRGLVLGSALGMAAMAMINKQAQSKAASNNLGTTSSLGHISYDSSDKKYPSFSSGTSTTNNSSTTAPINAMSDEAVISDILK